MNCLFGLSSKTNLFPRVIFLFFILRVGESIERIHWKVQQIEVQQEMIFSLKLDLRIPKKRTFLTDWKIWRALFSWNTHFEIRCFVLLPTTLGFVKFSEPSVLGFSFLQNLLWAIVSHDSPESGNGRSWILERWILQLTSCLLEWLWYFFKLYYQN